MKLTTPDNAAPGRSISAGSRASGRSASTSRPGELSDALCRNPLMMPLGEKPGYNSLRVQKAYRINGIEACRLDKQIQILERQKVHTVRIVNNNIRLTKTTLDVIEASSGHAANNRDFETTKNESNDAEYNAFEAGDKPMFLYGERKVSRRVGKFRRIQSAMVKGKSSSTNNEDTISALTAARPKSSIPTFNKILERVGRQSVIDPNWDPNQDLPQDELERLGISRDEVEKARKSRQAWSKDINRGDVPTEATREEKIRPGRVPSSVSWRDERNDPEGQSESSSTASTGTGRHGKKQRRGNSLLSNEETNPRTKSAPLRLRTYTEKGIKEEEATDVEKLTKAPRARSAAVGTKSNRRRDHPMAKIVGKTQQLISKAKKIKEHITGDPEKDSEGPAKERARKAKEAKLKETRKLNRHNSKACDQLVDSYLNKYPIDEDSRTDNEQPDPANAMTNYVNTRTELQNKGIL